jgi:hypothetical protein
MSCIANINPLYNSYFYLTFGRGTQQFELLCQKANLPGCTVPDTGQPTIFGTTVPIPTMQFNYETLNVEFIVDSDLTNWKSIYSWMRNLSNIETDGGPTNIPYYDWHATATLVIMNPTCQGPVLSVAFKHIVPTRLSGIVFQSDSTDALIQKATCNFKFSYFILDPDAPNDLRNIR